MFTLQDFLELDYINPCKIMTQVPDMGQIPIHSISVIEIPVDNFIRANEIVLTTALGCCEDDSLLLRFVKEVYASQAAALAISLKSNSYYLPPSVLEFAEAHRFPIIMLAWECRFAEIIEIVLEKIKNEHSLIAGRYEKMQKELLSMYLNKEDLDKAADLMARHLACHVLITDEKNNLKGADLRPYPQDFQTKPDRAAGAPLVMAIQANGKLYGYLILEEKKKNRDLLTEKHYIEKYAVMPLTLWFNMEDVINITTLKLKNDYVWNLINNRFSGAEERQLLGKKLGFDLQRSYICIICKITAGDPVNISKVLEQEILASIYSVESLIIQISKKQGRKIMSTAVQGNVAFYCENRDFDHEKKVFDFIDLMEEDLKKSYPHYRFYWGISEIQTGEANFHQLYLDANLALYACLHSASGRNRGTFKDSAVFKILSTLSEHTEIHQLSQKALAPLLDYQAKHFTELMETLIVFIKNNYNLSQTARQLHLHRQSLIYRMKKIEELTGLALDDHNNLFLLEIYTRMNSTY
ncbi:MAG: PucR family transcriptional regulator ligand-binding domain-containing protein [Peptococcaceae bacterium]|nr:PucR family transcriptional regulator ligand-binding domain-containing protein [Peptococcaceae bacterium]